MIRVRLRGGLGNQMFEYAFGNSTAKQLNTTLDLDLSWLLDKRKADVSFFRDYALDVFSMKPDFAIRPNVLEFIYKLPVKNIGQFLRDQAESGFDLYQERHFHVDSELINSPRDNALYFGHWQSPKYFENNVDGLKADFQFKRPLLEPSKSVADRIRSSNSVCLNVRRGEYLNTRLLNTTGSGYFHRSVKEMARRVGDPKIFVFSEDLDWCKSNLDFGFSTTFIEHDHDGYKYGNYLHLMSLCKHFIIPNSTFAWWAAWLSPYDEKVIIAPKKWFNSEMSSKDLVPKEWIRL